MDDYSLPFLKINPTTSKSSSMRSMTAAALMGGTLGFFTHKKIYALHIQQCGQQLALPLIGEHLKRCQKWHSLLSDETRQEYVPLAKKYAALRCKDFNIYDFNRFFSEFMAHYKNMQTRAALNS